MTPCAACRKPLEHGTFCPYCGYEDKPAPRITVEVQRARFVLNQRCLARFHVNSSPPVRLQVRLGIEHISLDENNFIVPPGGSIAFPFVPTFAGEFRVIELAVVASDGPSIWAFKLDDQDLSIRVASTDAGSSGIVYNIHVQEIYGSDVNIETLKPVVEAEWQPIALVLDELKTRELRNPVKLPPTQPKPPAQDDKLAQTIADVLANPYSEQVVKRQVLSLASKNLHRSGVVAALVNGLRATKDAETRRELLDLLSNLDTSRFDYLQDFHTALMALFSEVKDRSMRADLLARLAAAMNHDERLAPFFIELADLSDEEQRVVVHALSMLPALSEEVVLLVLERARQAPADIQRAALDMAEKLHHWGPALVEALQPYKADPRIRKRLG
jgi:hypothetical protein